MTTSRSGVLRVAVARGTPDWNPVTAHDFNSHLVQTQVYETPYEQIVPGHEPLPRLFVAPLDGDREHALVRVGQVRAGLSFSDASPCDANAIAQALRRSGPVRDLVEIEAKGDRVTFRARRPVPLLERLLSRRWAAITRCEGPHFLGTGPFRPVDADASEAVRLQRNPFHRGRVALEEILFAGYASSQAIVAAFEAGDVDFTMALSRREAESLDDANVLVYPGNNTAFLFMNTKRPGLSDAAARRHIAAAIDRQRIARFSDENAAGLTARWPLPPRLAGGTGASSQRPPSRGAESGRPAGLPARLRMLMVWAPRPYLPAPTEAAGELARQLGAIGIEIEPIPSQDSREFSAILQSGDYDLVLGGWIAESEDAAEFLSALVCADAIPTPAGTAALAANFSRWEDEQAPALLQQYADARSPETLARLLDHLEQEAPFVPLLHGPSVVAQSPRVHGFVPTASFVPNFKDLELG